jgi:hypothetical protein
MSKHFSDENIYAAAIIVVILIMIGFAGSADMQDHINDEEFYCDMVQLYIDSDGENGWPNYKNRDCEGS